MITMELTIKTILHYDTKKSSVIISTQYRLVQFNNILVLAKSEF